MTRVKRVTIRPSLDVVQQQLESLVTFIHRCRMQNQTKHYECIYAQEGECNLYELKEQWLFKATRIITSSVPFRRKVRKANGVDKRPGKNEQMYRQKR